MNDVIDDLFGNWGDPEAMTKFVELSEDFLQSVPDMELKGLADGLLVILRPPS